MGRESGPDDNNSLARLEQKLGDIALAMEKLGIAEYVDMLHSPRRLFFLNFWAGVYRGFGMAIGFTILAAIVIYILQKIVVLNMPVIGNFIADIVNIVQNQLHVNGTVLNNYDGKI
jgi:hypothetical protein